MRVLGQHDRRLGIVAEIVQRRNQAPAVHLRLVDLLHAVIKPRRVAKAHRVGRREQPEPRVRRDDLVLVQQRELAVMLEHALDHEHHVRPPRVVFVKDDGHGVAQRPGQDALVELGHLAAVAQLDRVLADQVDPADMAVKVHPHRRPVQPRRHLFDMRGLSCAVIALDHDAPVVGEPRQDRERRIRVELVGRVDLRHAVAALRKSLDPHVGVDPEHVAHRDLLGRSCRRLVHSVGHPRPHRSDPLLAHLAPAFKGRGKNRAAPLPGLRAGLSRGPASTPQR